MSKILLADIGGTNARFAVGEAGGFSVLGQVPTNEFSGFVEASQSLCGEQEFAQIALCVAGPVVDGVAQLTNAGWHIDSSAIASVLCADHVLMLNDFEAQAHALARLADDDWQSVGTPVASDPSAPLVAIGPGTGLGVAILTHADGDVIGGEGGHVTLAARTLREWQVIEHLAARFGHVSAERVISGSGLALLFDSLCALDGATGTEICSGEDVVILAAKGNAQAREAMCLFTQFLATVASDLAVSTGARGGVYLCGGILPKWGAAFDADLFRQRFSDKGRFADYLEKMPTRLVTTPHAAFIGLMRALDR